MDDGTRIKALVVVMLIAGCGGLDAAPAADVRTLPGGPFEASGATAVPGGDGVLFVDDGRPGEVLWLRLGSGGAPTVTPVAMGGTIADPEGITNDGAWIYVVGSQSRGRKGSADLARFRFDPRAGRASGFESMSGLPAMLGGAVADGAKRNKRNGKGKGGKASALNIEGLAWDAASRRLLLGVRAPLAGGDALVVPLRVSDGALSASTVTVDAPLRVALDGNGIRSIEQSPDGGFLIVAGGITDASDFRLLRWSGSGAPHAVTSFPERLKPEGVARLSAGGRATTIVVGDSGHYAVLP